MLNHRYAGHISFCRRPSQLTALAIMSDAQQDAPQALITITGRATERLSRQTLQRIDNTRRHEPIFVCATATTHEHDTLIHFQT